jgi:RNA polymerase sigma-70 factor (ECF subfamily)
LEQEFHDERKRQLFDSLKSSLLAEEPGLSYAELGARLGLKEDAVKQAVHRMRRRYRELFREEIAQTVAGPGEVEDELKYLFAVLSG